MNLAATVALSWISLTFALSGFAQGPLSRPTTYDVLIRNGFIYDGSGQKPYPGEVAIRAGRVVAVGKLPNSQATTVVDAKGMAIAPGFINVLSHAGEFLIHDGRSMSDLKQGVTTEIFGESSWGPLHTPTLRQGVNRTMKMMGDSCDWTTLEQFLSKLERKGISPNVASYVSSGTIRQNVLGEEDSKPTAQQLAQMQALVQEAMEGGALGITAALIYPPASFASTQELIALCREAARHKGRYIVHLRSEGDRLEAAINETLHIGQEAHLPVEVYHLKSLGAPNWSKMKPVIRLIEQAQQQGQDVTADVYPYTAGSTGMTVGLPPYVLNGGFLAAWKRLQYPSQRPKIVQEIRHPSSEWENLFALAGSPDNIHLIGFEQDSLKKHEGKTLSQVAQLRGKDPIETALDLIVQDKSRIEIVSFAMSEENVRQEIRQPWVSFCSDAPSLTETDTQFGKMHPRTFGAFPRLLGHYVRDEKVISLEEAIRRLTSLPASKHKLAQRGLLKPGYFADIVVFDPAIIADRATFENPFQYAVGVEHVWVNGHQVLSHGEHTGALPGQALWGPGKKQPVNNTRSETKQRK